MFHLSHQNVSETSSNLPFPPKRYVIYMEKALHGVEVTKSQKQTDPTLQIVFLLLPLLQGWLYQFQKNQYMNRQFKPLIKLAITALIK